MRILLTFTSVITIISDICNKTDELKQVLSQLEKLVDELDCGHKIASLYKELVDEIRDPVIVIMKDILKDYELCVVKETLAKLEREVVPVLNSAELERYMTLKEKLTMIDSDPSERFKELDSRRWATQNKAEFGTADKLSIDIITGNQSASRNILGHKGWNMSIIIHRSRDIVGRKMENNGIIY